MFDANGESAVARQSPPAGSASAVDAAPATTERHVLDAFARYRARVFGYVRTIVRDAAGAEDITQEAFLRYFQELREGRTVHNAKAWLFRAAHNLALNQRRDDERLFQLEESVVSADPFSGGANAWLAEKHSSVRLHAALQQLSRQEQRCIELRAEGLLYREIADLLGVRISSVSNYVERAIGKLSQAMNAARSCRPEPRCRAQESGGGAPRSRRKAAELTIPHRYRRASWWYCDVGKPFPPGVSQVRPR